MGSLCDLDLSQINLIAIKYYSFAYCLSSENINYFKLGSLLCDWTLKWKKKWNTIFSASYSLTNILNPWTFVQFLEVTDLLRF